MDFTITNIPGGLNVWQCSAVWGFGHRCAASHGHIARCTCACGEERPPMSQCPQAPGMFIGSHYVIPVTVGGTS